VCVCVCVCLFACVCLYVYVCVCVYVSVPLICLSFCLSFYLLVSPCNFHSNVRQRRDGCKMRQRAYACVNSCPSCPQAPWSCLKPADKRAEGRLQRLDQSVVSGRDHPVCAVCAVCAV